MATKKAKLKMDDGIVMQLGTKLYSQPTWWVLIKELMQNAIDAKATKVEVNTDFTSYINFQDNGYGMTEEQLLGIFLTVGGTDKERDQNTIGGFGIAKLAIFSCDDFLIQSGANILTKEILSKHKSLKTSERIINGTLVSVNKNELFGWNGKENLIWYLKAVNRDITIYLNEELLIPFNSYSTYIPEYGKIDFIPSPRRQFEIIVRLNGLPLFRRWVSDVTSETFEGGTYLYEVETDLMPYDEGYPFNVTRESFIEKSPHVDNVSVLSNSLRKMAQDLQDAEKLSKRGTYKVTEYNIWAMYNPEINSKSLEVLKNFKKRIEIMFMLHDKPMDCEFGLLGKNNEFVLASYQEGEHGEKDVFFVKDDLTDPSMLTAAAIHEFTHMEYQNHYEEFANAMTVNMAKYLKFIKTSLEINA